MTIASEAKDSFWREKVMLSLNTTYVLVVFLITYFLSLILKLVYGQTMTFLTCKNYLSNGIEKR